MRRRGWRPDEITRGSLDAGYVDGNPVFRLPTSSVSSGLRTRCTEALRSMAVAFGTQAQYAIETVQYMKLEQTARGGWSGRPDEIVAAVEQAETAVRQHERRQVAARQEWTGLPILRVLVSFRGPRGRDYTAGAIGKIASEEAEELTHWLTQNDNYNQLHGHEPGHNVVSEGSAWPPFVIDHPATLAVTVAQLSGTSH